MTSNDTLRKQQKRVETDHQKYQREVQDQLSKQSSLITTIKGDNEKLRQDLSTKTGGAYSFQEQDKLSTMQSEVDSLEMKIHYEKMRRADINAKHSRARMSMMTSRKCMGGINITSDNTQLIEKQVQVLENRLDQALVKFNEALTYNKNLREQIDNLREERKVFQRIYKKLESELHEKKKSMADKIEHANQDYVERDNLKQQLDNFKATVTEEQKQVEEKFQQLDVVMQQYKAARELQQLQITQQQVSREKNRDSPALQQRAKGASDANELHKHDTTSEFAEGEEDLETVVRELTSNTNCSDLGQLLEKFRRDSDENYAMYNYVNDLNTQIEQVDKDSEAVRGQLVAEKGDVERRRALKELENELAATEVQFEQLQGLTQKKRQNLAHVRSTTEELFNKIGCNPQHAVELFGTAECTDLNLLPYLGLVEHRTNQLLFLHNRASNAEGKRRPQVQQHHEDEGDAPTEDDPVGSGAAEDAPRGKFLGVGPSVQANSTNTQQLFKLSTLPNTNVGELPADTMDDAQNGREEILSHDEMRERVAQRMARRNEREDRAANRRKGGTTTERKQPVSKK